MAGGGTSRRLIVMGSTPTSHVPFETSMQRKQQKKRETYRVYTNGSDRLVFLGEHASRRQDKPNELHVVEASIPTRRLHLCH